MKILSVKFIKWNARVQRKWMLFAHAIWIGSFAHLQRHHSPAASIYSIHLPNRESPDIRLACARTSLVVRVCVCVFIAIHC